MAVKTIRIVDVARLAGVSPSTVSHVLNGKRPISVETRTRVLDIIKKTGFVPDRSAQTLKSKRTGIVGFFASDITEAFVNQIIRGAEKELAKKGINLLFASGTEFRFDLDRAIEFLNGRRVDGLILAYEITMRSARSKPKNLSLPVVTINREISGLPAILPDNDAGGFEAAGHLLSRGVRRPVMITGPCDRPASEDRKHGFLRGMKEAGIVLGEESFFTGDFTAASGEAGMESILSRGVVPDGVFCANDYMAAGAINVLLRRGIKVPKQTKVVGFDNRDFSAFWPVPITTFDQPLEEMGRLSARLLLSRIEQAAEKTSGTASAERRYSRSKLLVRKSSGG